MTSHKNFQFIKIILILVFFLSSNFVSSYTGGNAIHVDLGVNSCNNNGICEPGEITDSCPVDCPLPLPPPPPQTGGGNNGFPLLNINNLSTKPDLYSVLISWTSTISAISTIRWGQNSEVADGTLKSIVYALNHKMEIINLKPGTMYYFTIESQSVDGRTFTSVPTSFLTKSLKDTSFPLNPRNVKSHSDSSGITISWQNPPDPNFSYIRIMRHEDRFRGNPFLGKLIYEGIGGKFLDVKVTPGKKYFYSLFARNNDGSFSSGVATSAVAFSKKKIPIPTPNPIPTPTPVPEPTPKPIPEIGVSSIIFFAYQYNQRAEILFKDKIINIDGDKDTIVDTNSKTLYDDFMWVENQDGELVGAYLFSYNIDSGRYQAVIPPLSKTGDYSVKIYGYKNNISNLIGEGNLQVKAKIITQIKTQVKGTGKCFLYLLILLLILLLLLLLLLKRRRKEQVK